MGAVSPKGMVVLVAGSASRDCSKSKLGVAHAFVRVFTSSVLNAGGGFVVFVSGEPVADDGMPLIFDWVILREIDQYVRGPDAPQPARRLVSVVTSQKAWSSKMGDEHRQLLARLSGSGCAELTYVNDDVHTGGNIGDEQIERASAMIAIGGGKGVADRASKMMRRGRPVLPLDLAVGALSSDGDGAIGLHKKLMTEPQQFFPASHAHVRSLLPSISLELQGADVGAAAVCAFELVASELKAARASAPIDITVLTALPKELAAVQNALGISPADEATKTDAGSLYWTVEVENRRRSYRVGVACIGGPGNADAAAAATELILVMKSKLVMMVGIAAGLRGKCRLGEVILSERVVAYEPAAVTVVDGASFDVPRPEAYKLDHSIQQDIVAYLADAGLVQRLSMHQVVPDGMFADVAEDALARTLTARPATVASGEKLLRDPARFQALRDLHGKIEIVEMEAAGVAAACHRAGAAFLIVRGISDFGDDTKNDRFHDIAAKAAAIVATDFLREGLRLVD